MNFRNCLVILFVGFQFQIAHAQCTAVNFNLPAKGCLSQKIKITSNVVLPNYEWDFCTGDFDQIPTASVFLNAAGAAFKVELIEQDGQYYGFYVSRSNRKLYRLDFGANIKSTPAPVDLGDLGLTSVSPLGWLTIEIVKEGHTYYGFIIDYYNRVYRFSLGAFLTNFPSAAEVLYENALLSTPIDLAIVEDESGKYAFVANNGSDKLTRFSFSTSFGESSGLINVANVTVAGSVGFSGISFIRECDLWYAVTTSIGGGQITRIFFDEGLSDNTLTSSLITGLPFAPAAPGGVALAFENNKYYAFIQSQQSSSKLYKIAFENSMSNSPSVNSADLGNLGILSNVFGFAMYKVKSDWLVLASENTGSNIYRINFPNICFSDAEYSTTKDNITSVTNVAGTYHVSLSTTNAGGYFVSTSKSINILSDVAPDIALSIQNICVDNDAFFSVNSSANIVSYSWDFGDSQSSTDQDATHQYNAAGEYTVKVEVTSNNTCTNLEERKIKMYTSPSAVFTLPSVAPICTNNKFTFANNTIDSFEGNLTYQWFVDNNQTASTRDLQYAFLLIGDKDIKLIASIPGCSSESIQTLTNIQSGPTVGFDYTGQCQGESVQFTNNSQGVISDYLWDLGNGQVNTTRDVSVIYSEPDQYTVSLQTTGNNGCISSTSKIVTIYTKPQPNFSLDLPPFSCAGTPSQFNDLTSAPTDSNVSSWNWSFGDPLNGTAITKNPTYVYSVAGSYDVSLTTTTNFGCSASIIKSVQIADPPKAAFTTSATCLNQAAYFTDTSSGTNKLWLWKIGNSSYTLQNPAHVFSSTGNYTAQLTVTGNNDCISVLSKPINVPVPPALDFSVQNNCAGLITVFEDVTVQNADPAVSRVWDFGGKGSGSGASTQFSFPTPGAYNVKLTVTNQSGCNYKLSKNTPIVVAPIANFTTSVESGPPPLGVQFKNASSNATTFKWEFNDMNNSTSVEVSPSFTYTSLGDFVVDLTASNAQGCIDIESKIINVIIPYTEIELEQFTLLRDAATGSVRPVLKIKNNSNYTISNVTVVLDIAGKASVREKINTTILPNASSSQILNYELLPGESQLNYLCAELQLTDDVDLVNNSECISLESEEIVFSPYPNPVQEQLSVDWIAATADPIKITIMTQMGQIAYSKNVGNVGVGLNQIVLDLSQLNSGNYIFLFESSDIKKTFPIVIVN